MPYGMLLNKGQRVTLLTGDEKGGWGTLQLIKDDEYHVALYGGSDVRLYDASEIRPSYYIVRQDNGVYAIMRVGKRGGTRWIVSYKGLATAEYIMSTLLSSEQVEA